MMSTATFSLFLLAAFVHCGHSAFNEPNTDLFPLNQISDNNEVEIKFLENNILRGIDHAHLCDDPSAALCGKDSQNYTRPAHLKQAYPYIRNHLIDILSQPATIKEVTALSIEKTLFSKCMNLGLKSDSGNVLKTMNFISNLFQKISNLSKKWQDVDNKFNSRGFGFSFFDVGVERDPGNPKQNIIVVQPPSYSDIKGLYDLITNVFNPGNEQHISKSLVWRFFDTVIDQEAVKQFFRKWTEIFSQSTTRRKQEKMSLTKWNEEYFRSSDKVTSKINWQKLIKQNFARVDVDVMKNATIIIRNKDYFISLANLLGYTSNDVIVAAMKSKLILENIRYIDYPYAEALRHRKKSLFCYSNTKLYGASFRLLRDLKKEDSSLAANFEILDTMLHNIADVFLSTIDNSNDLVPKEKTYLRAQVQLITSSIIKHKRDRRIIDEYYLDYDVRPSYFASIVDYRKMLKDKELGSLKRPSKDLSDTEPFSVIDLAKPRNRFILNVFASSFLLSKLPIPNGLQKEVHYGIYGTKIASFLYGLLNENKFENEVNLTGRVDWYDHPNYPTKSLQCFVGEDVKSYGRSLAAETVSQTFGARIAYKAMLKDYSDSQVNRPYLVTSSNSEKLLADQLFFVAYGKYNCDFGRPALKTILLNLEEYKSAFQCKSLYGDFNTQCPLSDFQIQRKNYFVNQPF